MMSPLFSRNVILKMLKNFKFNSVFVRMLVIIFSVFFMLCIINFVGVFVLRQQAVNDETRNSEFYADYSCSYMQNLIGKLDNYLYSLAYDSNVALIRNLPENSAYYLHSTQIKDICTKLSMFKDQIGEIANVYIYFPNTDRVFTPNGVYKSLTFFNKYYKGDFGEWKKLLDSQYSSVFNIWTVETSRDDLSRINLIKPVYGSGNGSGRCVVVANAGSGLINTLFQDSAFASQRKIYILDRNLGVLSSNTYEAADRTLSLNPQQFAGADTGSFFNSQYLLSYRYLPNEGIYFAVMTPNTVIFSVVNKFIYTAYVFLGIMLLAGFILSVVLSQQFYMPIGQMLKDMELFAVASVKLQGEKNEYEYIRSNMSALYLSNRRMEEVLRGSLPVVKDIVVMKLLMGGQEAEPAGLLMRQYGIVFESGRYLAAVARCAGPHVQALQKAISDGAPSPDPAACWDEVSVLMIDRENIAVVYYGHAGDEEAALLERLKRICERMDEAVDDDTVIFGLGSAEGSVERIHESYRAAAKALEERHVQDGSRIYRSAPDSDERAAKAKIPASFEERYMNSVASGNLDASESMLEDILEQNYARNIRFLEYRRLCGWLHQVMGRIIDNSGAGPAPDLSREILEDTPAAGDVNELNGRLLRNNRLLCTAFSNMKKEDSSFMKILSYIDENFTTNINLDTAAIVLGYNPSYLSRMFKRYMGTGFSEHLAKKRIDHAKTLLRGPARMIKDIAQMCGYNNTSIFIKAFEKLEGVTPGEYQKRQAPE